MNTRQADLLKALALIQQHAAHSHHDIITIHHCAPVSTEAELIRAIDANMAQIARWSNFGGNKRRLARAA